MVTPVNRMAFPVCAGSAPTDRSSKGLPVGAAPFPLPDDVVAFGDEVCRAPELEVGEGRAERLGELPDLVPTTQRGAERVFVLIS
jgi:hypothetical protein